MRVKNYKNTLLLLFTFSCVHATESSSAHSQESDVVTFCWLLKLIKTREDWHSYKDDLLDYINSGIPINTHHDDISLFALAVKFDDTPILERYLSREPLSDFHRNTLFLKAKSLAMVQLLHTYKIIYQSNDADSPLCYASRTPKVSSDVVLFYLRKFKENPFETKGAIKHLFLSTERYNNPSEKNTFNEKLSYLTDESLIRPTYGQLKETLAELIDDTQHGIDDRKKMIIQRLEKLTQRLSKQIL